jgi:hypothetical protein
MSRRDGSSHLIKSRNLAHHDRCYSIFVFTLVLEGKSVFDIHCSRMFVPSPEDM